MAARWGRKTLALYPWTNGNAVAHFCVPIWSKGVKRIGKSRCRLMVRFLRFWRGRVRAVAQFDGLFVPREKGINRRSTRCP